MMGFDSYTSSPDQSQAMSILADNLMKLKNQMIEFSVHQQSKSEPLSQPQSPHESPEPLSPTTNEIAICYNQFTALLPSSYKAMTYQDKIQFLLSKKQLGSLIHLFEIIYYFREALPPQLLINISDSLTQNLNFESELEIRCMFQLLAYIGVVDEIMIQNIYKLVLEESLPFDIGFLYLINSGILGFEILVEIAGGQFNGLPLESLNYLARSEIIIQEIIIPCILNDLNNCIEPKRKTSALSLLSKLYNLTSSPKVIQKMVKMFEEQKQVSDKNRSLIASILRSSGKEGEKELIRLLKSNQNNKLKLPLVNIMSWKVPAETQLQIEVIEYTIASAFTPGSMFKYEDNSQYSTAQGSKEEGVLYLNSRDFLASLNRFAASESTETARNQDLRVGSFNCSDLSKLVDFVKTKEKKNTKNKISEEVIKSLHLCLSNPIMEIREAALKSLGNIGLPEGADSVDKVVRCLSDPQSRNRAMACLTLSKICRNPSQKIIKKLVELLKDSFWKVRNEACLTLSVIVDQPDQLLIGGLIKALKDGSINRQTVCETIIQLGSIGQEILVDLLKLTHPTDTKVLSAIIPSFSLANIESPSIDYLIQELFKHCRHQNPSIRALCLECLNHLRIRSSEINVTYLKAKNILPLFYFFLQDPSAKLRDLAVQSILSFGSHAELIFIEGVTKSLNPTVRSECVKGLAKMGPQNFRAILFGLRDTDPRVRMSTSAAILNNIRVQDVIEQFEEKKNHVSTLICHLSEILEGYSLCSEIEEYLYYLLEILKSKKEEGKEFKVRGVNNQNIISNH